MVVIALFITSCDKYVDITPKGIVIPRTIEDLQAVLSYDNDLSNAAHANDYFMNDDGFIPPSKIASFTSGSNLNFRNAFEFKDHFYTETENDTYWDYNYVLIGDANYVLDRLDIVTGSESLKNDVKGQALVHRASCYLTLVNLYARHYAAGDPNEPETGLPLVTTFGDAKVSLVRSSIQEVYDLIVDDLTEALTLLNLNIANYKFMASKVVAYGLLARAYLDMGEYQLALENATSALAIQGTLLNYSTELASFGNTLGDPTGLITPAYKNVQEIIMHKRGIAAFTLQFSPVFKLVPFTYVTQEVLNLYDQVNDTRYTKLIIYDQSAGAYRWIGGDNFSVYYMVDLTVSEVLLIRAESNARLGNISDAMNDINDLRYHRFDSNDPLIVELTAGSTTEAVQQVLDERRRELLYRGIRYFDIKRLNAIDNAGIGITRTDLSGATISLPANDPKWVMPIPQKEILLNPDIKQNPR